MKTLRALVPILLIAVVVATSGCTAAGALLGAGIGAAAGGGRGAVKGALIGGGVGLMADFNRMSQRPVVVVPGGPQYVVAQPGIVRDCGGYLTGHPCWYIPGIGWLPQIRPGEKCLGQQFWRIAGITEVLPDGRTTSEDIPCCRGQLMVAAAPMPPPPPPPPPPPH